MLDTYTKDDFRLGVQVEDQDGNVLDLTGASYEALLSREGSRKHGEVEVVNASLGTIRVSFHDHVLSPGLWSLQVRVTIGARTHTVVAETLRVLPGA